MNKMHTMEECITKLEYREEQSTQTLSKIPGVEKWEIKKWIKKKKNRTMSSNLCLREYPEGEWIEKIIK